MRPSMNKPHEILLRWQQFYLTGSNLILQDKIKLIEGAHDISITLFLSYFEHIMLRLCTELGDILTTVSKWKAVEK